MNNNIFYVLYNYLEERHRNNIYQNAKQDADYLKTTQPEKELNNQYEALNLSAKQRNVIDRWIDTIHAQYAAYNAVVFRMAMQYCFSLILELADLK